MHCPDIHPEKETTTYVLPKTLGTFEDVIDLRLHLFSDPSVIGVDQLLESIKYKPVVTFCTACVRCEKESPLIDKKRI